MHTRLKCNAHFGYKKSFTCRSINKNMKCIFRSTFCKSLEIRRFTLGHTFCPPFLSHFILFVAPSLSFSLIFLFLSISLFLSLSFSFSLSLSFSLFSLFLYLSLFFSLQKIMQSSGRLRPCYSIWLKFVIKFL